MLCTQHLGRRSVQAETVDSTHPLCERIAVTICERVMKEMLRPVQYH